LFGGVFAIFGHGNVAGIGEALYSHRDALPTFRAHNEQADGACGDRLCQGQHAPPDDGVHDVDRPGATNMVTAAALAHVNRLPVLLLPGDVFRFARAGPGAAAGRGLPRRRRIGQRLLQAGVALFRSHHASGAVLTALPRAQSTC
jgi:hypothetical protein